MNTRRFRRSWTFVLLGLVLIALTVAPLGAQDALPRNETLYVGGFQWGPPSTFNPLTSGVAWPNALNNYIYEALFGFNVATGALDPILAKDLSFTDDTTAVITLQDGTKWQDGTPLTPDDVVYTYELAKTHEDLQYVVFWDYVNSMTATGDRTVEVKLNPDRLNPGIVKFYLGRQMILPKHIWQAREGGDTSLSQVVDMEPLGSGPYKLLDYSIERVALERDDSYWGIPVFGTPAPKYIVHPIFNSNDEGNLALQRGELDVSQQFAPQIWQMWENNSLPVGTWYKEEPYYVPGNIPLLHINIHKPGLDNVLVRRALAYSINYPQIAATAMSRYSAPAQSSLILPTGGEAKFFNADQVAELGWEYNPDKAKEILETELGATKGSDGIYVLPDGTRLGPYTAMATFGWTDWLTAIEIMAQNATEAGIEVNTEFPEFPVINARRNNGDFDMLIWTHSGASPSSPWQRFRDALDDRGVPAFGEQAFWNWGRFSHPDVPALLDQAAATTDEATQKELFSQLDKIFLENIPEIPLMYRPLEFYEYNETYWTGFPNESNPVAPPQQQQAGVELLYIIKPK
ncbi:MAG: ABC transporter substrate-binding protein [Anaerolineae bacterium]|nr:ABC transporter substrate-binding protein [Anaerolineae bacterium]